MCLERKFSPDARLELLPYEKELVKVKARIKSFKHHPSRRDLCSILLDKITVYPFNGESFNLDHIWVLKRHLILSGVKKPRKKTIINFLGMPYSYLREGGSSKERELYQTYDLSIFPLPSDSPYI